jgi:hypothetical protein
VKASSVGPPRIVPAVDPKKAGSKKAAPTKDRQAELLAMKEQFEHLASGQGAPLGKGTPPLLPVRFHVQPPVESRASCQRRATDSAAWTSLVRYLCALLQRWTCGQWRRRSSPGHPPRPSTWRCPRRTGSPQRRRRRRRRSSSSSSSSSSSRASCFDRSRRHPRPRDRPRARPS